MAGRPYPLGRTLEDMVMDYRIGKHHGLAPQALLALVDPMMERELPELLATVAHLGTCLDGEHGMFSGGAIRQWREVQRMRGANVVDFPAMDEGETA